MLAVSVVLAAWAALRTLRHATENRLVFDGQHWSLSGAEPLRVAQAIVVLDFQSLLLVRLDEPARRTQWLWPARRDQPARWQDLRRAVYSRPPSAGNPAAQPEAAIAAAAGVSSIAP